MLCNPTGISHSTKWEAWLKRRAHCTAHSKMHIASSVVWHTCKLLPWSNGLHTSKRIVYEELNDVNGVWWFTEFHQSHENNACLYHNTTCLCTPRQDITVVFITILSFHCRIQHISIKYYDFWNLRDMVVEFSDRFEMWLTSRQRCCRAVCQISIRNRHFGIPSCGNKNSWGFTVMYLYDFGA